MKPQVKIYDYAQRTFSNRDHCTQINGGVSAQVLAVERVRQMQAQNMYPDYAFVQTHSTGYPLVTAQPPYNHLAYLVVPKDKPAYYHYGLDSMLHVDWPEYLKWAESVLNGEAE